MKIQEGEIKKLLLDESYVSPEDMGRAEIFASQNKASFIDFLLKEGLVNKNVLGQAISEHFKVPFASLSDMEPAKDIVTKIPEEFAKKYDAVLFEIENSSWQVATSDPDNAEFKKALTELHKGKVKIFYGFDEDVHEVFQLYKKSLETRFSKIIDEQKRVAPNIVEEIVGDALSFHASDIHFEPKEDTVEIRFRIDGVLHPAGNIPKEYYESVLNRIKILAQLRIDEHFATQDGSIRMTISDSEVDLRISIAPTLDGEKVTARLLGEYVKSLSLGDLGLSDHDEKLLLEAAKKPFGMILVTGPTGSGKTTTLYSLIKYISSPSINVTTIEDPVEYKISGTNQIQVNPEKDITFAEGLRSIVRQDPDVILVGEIRDEETADIAVNAALTGHLLFSTFHANDASTAIPRLLDMDVEPFLLASTLEVIIAQRLVRRICPSCRHSVSRSAKEMDDVVRGSSKVLGKTCSLYEGKGCNVCNNTGYKGRIAVYEFVRVSPEIRELALSNPSAAQIWELARKQGAKSLLDDGLLKVKEGVTTLSEIQRVIAPS
jgi:type IV pilus assembly protein PilB